MAICGSALSIATGRNRGGARRVISRLRCYERNGAWGPIDVVAPSRSVVGDLFDDHLGEGSRRFAERTVMLPAKGRDADVDDYPADSRVGRGRRAATTARNRPATMTGPYLPHADLTVVLM
jgi:hypothetical protein